MNRTNAEQMIKRFDPKMDSPIYRQIVEFARHNDVPLRPQFLDELEIFARNVELAFQRTLTDELTKQPQPFTDPSGKTWIYTGGKP